VQSAPSRSSKWWLSPAFASGIKKFVIFAANIMAAFLIVSTILTSFSGKIRFDPQVRSNVAKWSNDPAFDRELDARLSSYVSGLLDLADRGSLNPVDLQTAFDKINDRILGFSLLEDLVRRVTGISQYEKGYIVLTKIIDPLIECVFKLKKDIPRPLDGDGLRDYTQLLYGTASISVQYKTSGDDTILQESFSAYRDRAASELAQCEQLHRGLGKYIYNALGAPRFAKFSENLKAQMQSGAWKQRIDTIYQQLDEARPAAQNYNQRNRYINMSSISRNNLSIMEYSTKIFQRKCPSHFVPSDGSLGLPASSEGANACDPLTLEYFDKLRYHHEKQKNSIDNMNYSYEQPEVITVPELMGKIFFILVLLVLCNSGVVKPTIDTLFALASR
jgi:hypothetical protein